MPPATIRSIQTKSRFSDGEYHVCMIFKSTREPVKQIGIWFGVVSLLPLATWYGTSTFSPPPDSKEHYKTMARLDEKILAAGEAAEREKLRQEKERLETEHDEAGRVFYRDMFWVAYPVGLVAVIFGILFRVQPVGGGLVFGGLIALGVGCYSYWDKMEGWHRFASLLLVLLVLMVLGSWRFWRAASDPPGVA